jgi:prevent-host-death family protein
MRTELVTTLKRKATDLISQLSNDKEPVLITQHGVPAAYLVDVNMFESMESRLSLLEGIARGEKAILENRVLSHEDAKQRMARWLA